MKVERKALLSALKAVRPAISKNEQVEQSGSFIFLDKQVFTYNNEIAVSHPVDIDLVGAVPAQKFYELVNRVKTEQIGLDIKDGTLLLEGSKAKAGLRIETEILLPLEQVGMPKDDDWRKLPINFCDAISACMFSASKNEQQAILTNLHVFDGYIESCDNRRITRYDMGEGSDEFFPVPFLIPTFAAKELLNHCPTEYAVTAGWLHFVNINDAIFSCRHYEDEYPDYSSFLECKGVAITFPAGLSEVLDRAAIFSDGERVSLILDNNELVVAAESEAGWFEEPIAIEYKGKAVEFDIQPDFMKSIIKFKGKAVISEKALRFDADDFIHVAQIMTPKAK